MVLHVSSPPCRRRKAEGKAELVLCVLEKRGTRERERKEVREMGHGPGPWAFLNKSEPGSDLNEKNLMAGNNPPNNFQKSKL